MKYFIIFVFFNRAIWSPVMADKQEHDEHGENSQVCPGKCIQAANEEDGINLSAVAGKNFEILLEKVRPDGNDLIPKGAVVTAVAEVIFIECFDSN